MTAAGLLEATAAVGQTCSAADLATISTFVRARSGIVIGPDKSYLVAARLAPVARRYGIGGVTQLCGALTSDHNEDLASDVLDAMTTNETFFFRDGKLFDHLRDVALPALAATRPVRIWSAACSSGQEAYSIAICVLESGLKDAHVEIVGTDISSEQVKRAQFALYSDFEAHRGLDPKQLASYFDQEPGGWRAREKLRRMAYFQRWNLLQQLEPLGTFDIVFCRNVLIYFDIETRRRVLDAIWKRLVPGGLLYLGGTESTLGISDRFTLSRDLALAYTAVPE